MPLFRTQLRLALFARKPQGSYPPSSQATLARLFPAKRGKNRRDWKAPAVALFPKGAGSRSPPRRRAIRPFKIFPRRFASREAVNQPTKSGAQSKKGLDGTAPLGENLLSSSGTSPTRKTLASFRRARVQDHPPLVGRWQPRKFFPLNAVFSEPQPLTGSVGIAYRSLRMKSENGA
jgi:hypothetical protein